MTNEELQQLVENISIKYFAKPFNHRAYFNGRLKTTGGRYHLNDHNIDINPRMDDGTTHEVLIGIIKHELCHYHLHLAGYSAKHNTRQFKQLLRAVGGSRYAPRTQNRTSQIKYIYRCEHCGLEYHRRRKINLAKFVCGRCHGKLHLIKEVQQQGA